MGCGNSRTSGNLTDIIENFNVKNQTGETKAKIIELYKIKNNVCINRYSGFIIKGLDFKNCLIKSQKDLDNNLRMFIPSKIPKMKKGDNGYNFDDDIFTNMLEINFNKFYIIAVKDIYSIDYVIQKNGNYIIYHNNKKKWNDSKGFYNLERYMAFVVKKLEGDPKIIFKDDDQFDLT